MSIQPHIRKLSSAPAGMVGQGRRARFQRGRLCRLIPLLMLLPASLVAQTTLGDAIGRLKPGQRVRLHSQSGQRAEGRFSVYEADSSVVQLAMRDTTIRFAMVDSLWVRKSGAKTGALIGAVALGVPTAVLFSSGWSSDEWRGLTVIVTAAGTGAGVLLGAVIGSTTSRWQLRYAAPHVALKFAPLPSQRFGVGFSIRLPAVSR